MMRENTHMEHFEDLLFESWGFELLEKFKIGEVDYTRKWDGAPSIFFGKDEDGYWIARKGIFNKKPLKYYERSDFDADPKFPEELKDAMWNTLVYLSRSYVGPENNMVQGDLMFYGGSDKWDADQTANGNVRVFHPNTIRYETTVIPRSAVVGIVWHTAYTEDKVIYGAKIKEQFRITDELWMINAHDEVSKPKDIDLPLRIVKSVVGRYSDLSDETKSLYKMWRNAQIKGTVDKNDNITDFMFDRMLKEVNSVKDADKKAEKIEKYRSITNELTNVLNRLNNDYELMIDAKEMLLMELNNQPTCYKTSVLCSGGIYRSVDHEGYAMYTEGYAAKLVNREEFSKNNFSDDIVKGWQK